MKLTFEPPLEHCEHQNGMQWHASFTAPVSEVKQRAMTEREARPTTTPALTRRAGLPASEREVARCAAARLLQGREAEVPPAVGIRPVLLPKD